MLDASHRQVYYLHSNLNEIGINMKTLNKLAITILLPFSLLACSGSDGKVVATYKGGKVTESEVMNHFKKILESQEELKDKKFSDLDPRVQDEMIRKYILGKMMDKEAKDEKIEDTESFKEKMKNAREQIVVQELVEKYVKKYVTDSEVENTYNQLVKSWVGKSEMQASHILVATKELADELEAKLVAGADFASLAKEYSMDSGSKEKGGSLGRFVQGQFVPEFETQIAKMKKGEISEPIKTQFGWHIIRLEDKKPFTIPSKDDARQMVINKLNNDAANKLISDLMSKAEVKISAESKTEDKKIDSEKAPEAASSEDKSSGEKASSEEKK